MGMKNNQAYAEVLRQLPTAELLQRYYHKEQTVNKILKGRDAAGRLTIAGVQMSEQDARDYLIMRLVDHQN